MSGGFFEYKQHYVADLVDEMEGVLERCDIEPDPETDAYWDESGSLKPCIEDMEYFKEQVAKAKEHLQIANVLVQRIDWYLSGDDGDENFKNRLKEELKSLNINV